MSSKDVLHVSGTESETAYALSFVQCIYYVSCEQLPLWFLYAEPNLKIQWNPAIYTDAPEM